MESWLIMSDQDVLDLAVGVCDRWSLTDKEICTLLEIGEHPSETDMPPSESTTIRAWLVLAIADALSYAHGPIIRRDWLTLPNSNAIFAGRSPLLHMLFGGHPAMENVWTHLTARRPTN
jgi:hypothetical protein